MRKYQLSLYSLEFHLTEILSKTVLLVELLQSIRRKGTVLFTGDFSCHLLIKSTVLQGTSPEYHASACPTFPLKHTFAIMGITPFFLINFYK